MKIGSCGKGQSNTTELKWITGPWQTQVCGYWIVQFYKVRMIHGLVTVCLCTLCGCFLYFYRIRVHNKIKGLIFVSLKLVYTALSLAVCSEAGSVDICWKMMCSFVFSSDQNPGAVRAWRHPVGTASSPNGRAVLCTFVSVLLHPVPAQQEKRAAQKWFPAGCCSLGTWGLSAFWAEMGTCCQPRGVFFRVHQQQVGESVAWVKMSFSYLSGEDWMPIQADVTLLSK